MKKSDVVQEAKIQIPRIEDDPEHQQRIRQLQSLKAELSTAEARSEELRRLLENQGKSRIKQVTFEALAALGLGKGPEFKAEELSQEKANIEAGLPMLKEKIRLLEDELRKLATRLYGQRNEELKEPYKAKLKQAYQEHGLPFARMITEIEHDWIEELRLQGGAFAHVIEPFEFREMDLSEPFSKINMRFMELKRYGVEVDGWQDPIVVSQPKPGPRRRVDC